MEPNLLQYLAQQQPAPAPLTVQPAPGGTPTAPAGKSESPMGSMWTTGLMFAAVFVGMYFLVIRPQRKEEKRKKELLSKLGKGDRVVTSSGMIGTVQTVKDETVIVNVGDNTRIEFLRSAIADIRGNTEPRPAPTPAKKS